MANNSKYLSELMENVDIKQNTLIISPTGSGKTYYILNKLCKNKKTLYLCDTTNLKLQILKEDGTQDYNRMIDENKITVMTYSKFGKEIKYTNEGIMEQFDYIICDEVHNLIDYENIFHDVNLDRAMEYLTRSYKNTIIVFFTATPQYLDYTVKKYPWFDNNFTCIDFSDNAEIKRYTERSISYIAHYTDVRTYLTKYLNSFNQLGEKCLIFSPYIKTMRELENICGELGLRPICIWSENNEKIPMTFEQRRVRNYLIENGELIEPYNVLIINRATETGVNIYDDKMQIMICNTKNEVQQIQARGRIRHDIDLLVLKTEEVDKLDFAIDKEILNLWLTKETIIERVIVKNNMRDTKGRVMSLQNLIKEIENYGFSIEKKKKGKRKIMHYMIKEKVE